MYLLPSAFFSLNTKAATILVNKNISVEKHSSLKPHFTLPILPPSPPLCNFLVTICSTWWKSNVVHVLLNIFCQNLELQIDFLYCLKTQKVRKAPKELLRGCRLYGQVSGNIFYFFKTVTIFFHKQIFSSILCISLVLENYWLLQSSDSFSAKINCILWIRFNVANWQKIC